MSNDWRGIDEAEARRLSALAREVMPRRRFEKVPEARPVQPVRPPPMPGRTAACRAADAVAADDAVAGRRAVARAPRFHQGPRKRRGKRTTLLCLTSDTALSL